jgi:ABC-type transporter Mla subunit MlaD
VRICARDIGVLLAGLGVAVAGFGIGIACWHLAGAADAVADAARAIPGRVDALIDVTRGLPAAILPSVLKTVDDARRDVTARAGTQITALRLELLPRVDALTTQLSGVRTDLQPTFQNLAAITATANKDLTDARPAVEQAFDPTEVAGVVRDTRFAMARAARTFGNVEAATDDFRGALPKILLTWEEIGQNVKGATDASAKASANANTIMGNLAAATKPLPRGVRLGFQIGGPAAQITSYVILMLATLGVL